MKGKFPAFISSLVLVAAFTLPAMAKDKSSEVQIYEPTQISGTTLQPGIYKVKMTDGATPTVTFLHNGKQVASVTGQAVQLAKTPSATSVTSDNSGSIPQIAEIDFEGSQTGVTFTSHATTTAQGE